MGTKVEHRGGARPGSGRPAKSKDGARVTFSVMVSPVTRRRITELRAAGVKLGEAIDAMVAQLATQYDID
mgnify:FL=1